MHLNSEYSHQIRETINRRIKYAMIVISRFEIIADRITYVKIERIRNIIKNCKRVNGDFPFLRYPIYVRISEMQNRKAINKTPDSKPMFCKSSGFMKFFFVSSLKIFEVS
jgi:hypothetical protein